MLCMRCGPIKIRLFPAAVGTPHRYLQREVHVVLFVAGKPDESVRPVGAEDEFEGLEVVLMEIGGRHQVEVVHDPPAAMIM